MKLALVFVAAAVALPAGWSAREKSAAGHIQAATIAAHVRFLSDDLLEGRAPASRGSELAMRYIAAQYERLGLEPAGDDGGWIQKFDMMRIKSQVVAPPTLTSGGKTLTLSLTGDAIVGTGRQTEASTLHDAEVVFAGYGITAPEQKWDDYKDDVKGKVVLIMNNDPENDPALFAGKTRLYYGRWDYKYAEAARHGAAGVIIIHTEPSAGYPWQVVQSSWSGEQFELPAGSEPRLDVRMWATEDASRKIVALGGKDLDELRRSAESRDFRPVALGVKLSVSLKVSLVRTQSGNVLGMLPGSDPKLKQQLVVLTAHHDHLGMREGKGDTIYNGALDNASGVAAMLNVAEALASLPTRPRRSVLFAAVGAEESGLLGSQFFCEHPTVPPGRIAANVNIDTINVWGRTSDVGYIALGKSSLDDVIVPAAKAQGRMVTPDERPDKGGFYRSDQFNFARIGVPALFIGAGIRHLGHDATWGRELHEKFTRERYHQPSDQIDSTWNLEGAVEDMQLMTVATLRIADAPRMPSWKKGDEFEAVRLRALEAAK